MQIQGRGNYKERLRSRILGGRRDLGLLAERGVCVIGAKWRVPHQSGSSQSTLS